MKHKRVVIVAVIIAIISATIVGLYKVGNDYFSDTRIIEENWNITLPTNMKEVYSKNGPTDFQGHGYRYTVFHLGDANDDEITKGTTDIKNVVIEEATTSILNKIGVENSKYPDFAKRYQWRIISKYSYNLYIIFEQENSLVYFIQDMP